MRCQYCHNPDTWEFHTDTNGLGREVSAEEILNMYDGVKEFLKDGGLTCTGGEPMAQLGFLTELFEKAKERGIHTCLDTSGITFNPDNTAAVDRLMDVTDVIMLDIKHIDDVEHKKLTGQSNKNILDVLPYHDMGKVKYQNLGIDYVLKDVEPLSKADAVKARDVIMQGIRDGLMAERNK